MIITFDSVYKEICYKKKEEEREQKKQLSTMQLLNQLLNSNKRLLYFLFGCNNALSEKTINEFTSNSLTFK